MNYSRILKKVVVSSLLTTLIMIVLGWLFESKGTPPLELDEVPSAAFVVFLFCLIGFGLNYIRK